MNKIPISKEIYGLICKIELGILDNQDITTEDKIWALRRLDFIREELRVDESIPSTDRIGKDISPYSLPVGYVNITTSNGERKTVLIGSEEYKNRLD